MSPKINWKLKSDKEEEMESLKESLNNGAIIEMRDGDKCIFLKNAKCFDRKEDVFISLISGGYVFLSCYDENLTDKNVTSSTSHYDIMRICDNEYVGNNLDCHINSINSYLSSGEKWTWEREEVKEVTMSELEEKYGCKVKIIKE